MDNASRPSGEPWRPMERGAALVLAVSMEDAVHGCAGAIMRHIAWGDPLTVAVLRAGPPAGDAVDGEGHSGGEDLAPERRAAQVLECGAPVCWQMPEIALRYGERLVQRILGALEVLKPALAYAPSVAETDPARRALAMAAVEALRRSATETLRMYEVGVPLAPNVLLDITDLLRRKAAAIACFAEQRASAGRQSLALGAYRGSGAVPPVEAAEAYRVITAQELRAAPLALYPQERARGGREQAAPGGTRDALVSVIVRSMARHKLGDALDSLALQTYSNIEVVVVNAAGAAHPSLGDWCGRYPLRLIDSATPLERSRAANVGLDNARGDYLIFLDDDDLFFPNHVAGLVDALHDHGAALAAYAGVEVLHCPPGGREHRDVLNRPFDSARLRGQNFLPIHAVLFARAVLELGCRFDEHLERYEDWDFWLQVERHTKFVRVDRVSACYRNFGYSGFGAASDRELVTQARAAFFAKWGRLWSGAELSDVLETISGDEHIERLEAELTEARHQVQAGEERLAHAAQQSHEREEALVGEIRQRDEQLQGAAAELREREEQRRRVDEQLAASARQVWELEGRIAERERAVREREGELAAARAETGDRQRTIDVLLQSTSWRITAPLRWVGVTARRTRTLARLASHYVEARGGGVRGGWFLVRRVVRALRREGPQGVLAKVLAYRRLYVADHRVPEMAIGPAGERMRRGVLVRPHVASVDIVVCVHNALDDVQRCLASVVRSTFPPYTLVLVDDGSDPPTRDYLAHFARAQGALLLRNERARGYTYAANQGLRECYGDFVVLLNSDTVVTRDWLDRMVMCAEGEPRIGMVGPLSNTASWQSIPEYEADGDWAVNPLPPGVGIERMAELVAASSGRLYPRVGFLNGFCLLLNRRLISEVGLFDEDQFGEGYGEENDYCLRARQAGWELAVADDVYIYHAQSKSYSHERRKALYERAARALAEKHDELLIEEGVASCRRGRVLEGVRARARHLFEREQLRGRGELRWEGRRVLFVLPVADVGGGANIVFSEAQALRRMGVDACVLNLERHREAFEQAYPDVDIPVRYAKSADAIPAACVGFDAVIATANMSVPWLAPLGQLGDSKPVLGYYVQDFEPHFYEEGSAGYRSALASYTLAPGMRCFTKTEWNRREVRDRTGVECAVLGASCNLDLFRPQPRRDPPWPLRPLRIAAMIRPSSPRRSPRLTMEVLRDIQRAHGNHINVILFGTDPQAPEFLELPNDFVWTNLGNQVAEEQADLFNEVDIFVDFSTYQAMGLTAMEAMACGVAVIVPQAGGASSFASHESNALVVDTRSPVACRRALDRLIEDEALRARLQAQALLGMARHHPEGAAYRMMEVLFPAAASETGP